MGWPDSHGGEKSMTGREAVEEGRARLETLTPLSADCGRLCDAACCRDLEGEETGMLLFPGEEDAYRHLNGWKVRETALGSMVICPGTCEREMRPLSCRIFPLLPVMREGKVKVAMDQRAGVVCPLYREGLKSLSEDFRLAVRETGEALAESEEGRAILERLTEQNDDLKRMRSAFGA